MPARILEIGAWEGGTLWHWLQIATDHVVTVDDRMTAPHMWDAWAARRPRASTLLQGLSQDADIVAKAAANAPYDMVFIDGDHTYDLRPADWRNFSPMVVPGGIVALHDILERPTTASTGCGLRSRTGRGRAPSRSR
jgi:predicted O-methyltransferase YrrM